MSDWRSTVPLTTNSPRGVGATMTAVATKAQRLNVDNAQRMVVAVMEREMELFRDKVLKPEPPEPNRTDKAGRSRHYQRTHLLAASWVIGNQYANTPGGRGFAIDVFNPTPYAHWVYGDNQGQHQLGYHIETGWPNMYREFQKAKPIIVASAAAAFAAWAGTGGV